MRSNCPSARALSARLRRELSMAADPSRAPAMQAYMKSALPYYGVGLPEIRRICRRVFDGIVFDDLEAWSDRVLGVWDTARRREERYCAIALSGLRSARPFQTPRAIPTYERMIVSGAWWDVVDDIATHRVAPILKSHPARMRRLLVGWSKSDNLWKRRTAILSQIGARADVDFPFLVRCIAPSFGSREFFLNKAIGWALRDVAWARPDLVVDYVTAHSSMLSPLSRREALKNVSSRAQRRRTPKR
jgi:3-methyladenine DNA glycosylase AlkD